MIFYYVHFHLPLSPSSNRVMAISCHVTEYLLFIPHNIPGPRNTRIRPSPGTLQLPGSPDERPGMFPGPSPPRCQAGQYHPAWPAWDREDHLRQANLYRGGRSNEKGHPRLCELPD